MASSPNSTSSRASATATPKTAQHALSVDVEEWFQVWAYASVIDRSAWDSYPSRVEETTRRVFDLLERRDAKATFFVLGWIAERCPALIKEMAARGHEVASHGYDHTKVFEQSPKQFLEDVRKTKGLLEDLTGIAVSGYRAAGFSIDQRTPFAYEGLAKAGYVYSSSSHPISHDHYGDPTAPIGVHKVTDSLVEIPVAVVENRARRATCAGGGWFRAMPYANSRRRWQRLTGEGRRGVFYFHPWEIDPDQPRVKNAPLKSTLRHRLFLGQMEGKLERLFTEFSWGRIDHVFADVIAARREERPCSPVRL